MSRDFQKHLPEELKAFPPYDGRPPLFSYLYTHVTLPGDWAEFGVWTGGSCGHLLRHLPKGCLLWLFDSFEGLPENWNQGNLILKKGVFGLKGNVPFLGDPKLVRIVKGWFEDTVAAWAEKQTRPLGFIHIDSDLYTSCKTVLDGCKKLIVPGTIITFDEIIGYPNWKLDEYRALMEADFKWEWLARTKFHQAGIKVTG